MNLKNVLSTTALACIASFGNPAMAQYPIKIHSHNDYTRIVPFYEAYSQKIYSIEVDMFYRDGEFYVSHDEVDIHPQKTFEALYLRPLLSLYEINKGKAWADAERPLQLVVEIKSDNTDAFMNALVAICEKYPEVFNPNTNPNAVHVVITGHVPAPDKFSKYPSYITFDGSLTEKYNEQQLKQVAMFSENFHSLSHWNGKGSLVAGDKAKVMAAIDKAHAQGKPVRFWGAPDGMTAWNTFYWLGLDYINTDKVEQCAEFFRDWEKKNYQISGAKKTAAEEIVKTDRLDKTTYAFGGFHNEKMQLSDTIATYSPTYRNDGINLPVKNVILLIGDGMGLAQIAAADRVNQGLTMLKMKYMGMMCTSSKDAFTTDSAGSGSALSTGKKNSNRHICMSDEGEPYPLLTDFFLEKKRANGVVTLGNVADATPAVFYGHNVERDDADGLTRELLDGKLTLLAGSGMNVFTQRHDSLNLIDELKKKNYNFVTSINDINLKSGKDICIDERMGEAANAENIGLLGQATQNAIQKLNQVNPNGFFLMVEGAKIDYAGHARYFPGSILETLSFDQAVAEALEFADKNGQTLVIVTADHETGGLTLIDGDNRTGRVTACYVTDDHTPILIPVFAYGPQSNKFIGKYFNYDIPNKIKSAIK
ncbi:MAG: Alkaline phosphatase [Bacteroidetes bacterium]|nr:Alkaline phosphatase [Bacteroidota bacterium]